MAALRAILVLALLMHPLLVTGAPAAALLPCQTYAAPVTSCCATDCACSDACPCAIEAPSDLPAPAPTPVTPPTSTDARALPPAPTGLIAILPVIEPPAAAAVAAPHRPFRSCPSINALLCVWTT